MTLAARKDLPPVDERDTAAALAHVALRIPGWVRDDVPAGPDRLTALTRPKQPGNSEKKVAPYYRYERTLDPVRALQSALALDPFKLAFKVAQLALGRF